MKTLLTAIGLLLLAGLCGPCSYTGPTLAMDSDDIRVMDDMGHFFTMMGAAEKWQLDRDQRRLDFTLDNKDPGNAADLSRQACRHFLMINNTRLSEDWTVRVYFLNGEVGAQCRIAKMR